MGVYSFPHMADTDERAFVDSFIEHLTQPCGVPEGNLRSFYIREAERVLEEGSVKDRIECERLKSAVRMAKVFLDIENS